MASKDFIPHSNSEFDSWQRQFVSVAGSNLASWDLPQRAFDEWILLTATPGKNKMRWDAIWQIVSAKNCKSSERLEMRLARKEYESGNKNIIDGTSLRLFISRYIRNNPKVKETQKEIMKLTMPEQKQSATSLALMEMTLSGHILEATHLVQVSIVQIGSRKSKAKDSFIKDIQVFIAITDVKQDIAPNMKEFAYDGVVFRGLYRHNFESSQEGMRAWYYVRYMFKGKLSTYGEASKIWDGVIM